MSKSILFKRKLKITFSKYYIEYQNERLKIKGKIKKQILLHKKLIRNIHEHFLIRKKILNDIKIWFDFNVAIKTFKKYLKKTKWRKRTTWKGKISNQFKQYDITGIIQWQWKVFCPFNSDQIKDGIMIEKFHEDIWIRITLVEFLKHLIQPQSFEITMNLIYSKTNVKKIYFLLEGVTKDVLKYNLEEVMLQFYFGHKKLQYIFTKNEEESAELVCRTTRTLLKKQIKTLNSFKLFKIEKFKNPFQNILFTINCSSFYLNNFFQ